MRRAKLKGHLLMRIHSAFSVQCQMTSEPSANASTHNTWRRLRHGGGNGICRIPYKSCHFVGVGVITPNSRKSVGISRFCRVRSTGTLCQASRIISVDFSDRDLVIRGLSFLRAAMEIVALHIQPCTARIVVLDFNSQLLVYSLHT